MAIPVVQGPPIGLGNVNPDLYPDYTATVTTTTTVADLGTNCNCDPCGPWQPLGSTLIV